MECSNGAVKTAFDIQIVGQCGPLEAAIDPHDRDTWRSGVRSAMRAAKPVTWKGAHCCGYGPCTCMLIKNMMMMMMMMMILNLEPE